MPITSLRAFGMTTAPCSPIRVVRVPSLAFLFFIILTSTKSPAGKMISNDLGRLYAMGFLKRRRIKWECRTKSGKTCYRPYEYKNIN